MSYTRQEILQAQRILASQGRQRDADLLGTLLAGGVGAATESAILGSLAGVLLGASPASSILGGVVGDLFDGGLFD